MATDQLLLELVEAFEAYDRENSPSTDVIVTDVSLDLPIETQIQKGAALYISLPRGRLKTGFRVPHGRIRAHLQRFVENDG